MRLLFLFIFSLGTGLCPPPAAYAMVNDPAGIQIQSSNKKLERAFNWAVDMALSHVQTRKSGVVDRWEKGDGSGNAGYIPCYWGGYNSRTAFYSRDICHQVVGGHLLDLKLENYTMLREFAKTSNAERKWYPLWALNFDGSPFKLDYRNDSDFVREVPAAFELVDKAYQLYLWTGDKNYIEDENHQLQFTKYSWAKCDMCMRVCPLGETEKWDKKPIKWETLVEEKRLNS